jgi:hypothetical protein
MGIRELQTESCKYYCLALLYPTIFETISAFFSLVYQSTSSMPPPLPTSHDVFASATRQWPSHIGTPAYYNFRGAPVWVPRAASLIVVFGSRAPKSPAGGTSGSRIAHFRRNLKSCKPTCQVTHTATQTSPGYTSLIGRK